jgi:hypothetical protein
MIPGNANLVAMVKNHSLGVTKSIFMSIKNDNTKVASQAQIAAARQIFNSKSFVARITVTGIDNNDPDKTFEHRFFFDETCEELVKFFEQWGTHQCAMKMMDYAHNNQGMG